MSDVIQYPLHPMDMRIVHILHQTPHGTIEHSVTQAFLSNKAVEFRRKMIQCSRNNAENKSPRVCIAGWMDFLWLRSYCADYLNEHRGYVQMPEPPLSDDFPKHFKFCNVLVIEGLDNETGYTFA